MKLNLVFLLGLLLLSACSGEEDINDAFIIGTFFGECLGESCVEVFKISEASIFEDRSDLYPSGIDDGRDFQKVDGNAKVFFDQISNAFPISLLNMKDEVYGCPDCADQGGVYLKLIKDNKEDGYWIFDNFTDDVPEEYHKLMDVIRRIAQSLE